MNQPDIKVIAFPNKKESAKRTWLFKTIALLLPFLCLFLVEIGLRLFHYGDNLELFIEAPGKPGFLVLNPSAAKKFFPEAAMAPSGNSELFHKIKPSNTTRIFVLGESTTIGYPYFHNASFSRWLRYRLMKSYADHPVEIINLSLTGVNSYTVLDFASELVNHEPDAVMIYSGHNEFYGALGVASSTRMGNQRWLVRMVIAMKSWRIMQLATRLYWKLNGNSSNAKDNAKGQTLMGRMVADQQIAYRSPLYEAGIQQFSDNMEATLQLLGKRHIPVFISTLVSNEKDFKPFNEELNKADRPAGFEQEYAFGCEAFNAKNLGQATFHFKKALALSNEDPSCQFYLGQIAYQLGEYDQAKIFFGTAKDLDGLRFRAPKELNEIIKQLCLKYPSAHLVDTEAVFDSIAAHHIIGNELLLEHVHPNLLGYARMSDAFYNSMKKARLIDIHEASEMSFAALLVSMPITTVDSLAGLYRVNKLKKSWPFQELTKIDSLPTAGTTEEQLAAGIINGEVLWPEAMHQLLNLYINQKNKKGIATIWESFVLEHPENPLFAEKAGMAYGDANDLANAVFYFKRSFELLPSVEKSRYLYVMYLKMDQPDKALPYLDYAIREGNRNNRLSAIKALGEEIVRFQQEYRKDTANTSMALQIAEKYIQMGNRDVATHYIRRVIQNDPGNRQAKALMQQLQQQVH